MDYRFVIPKVNLNYALDDDISTQSATESGFKKFVLIDSTTNSKLGGQKAYELMFEAQRKGETFKYLTLGTMVNDNQVLKLSFKAPTEEFDQYLPTFQHMIDSFRFIQIENKSSTTEIIVNSNTNQDIIKEIFEGEDFAN